MSLYVYDDVLPQCVCAGGGSELNLPHVHRRQHPRHTLRRQAQAYEVKKQARNPENY